MHLVPRTPGHNPAGISHNLGATERAGSGTKIFGREPITEDRSNGKNMKKKRKRQQIKKEVPLVEVELVTMSFKDKLKVHQQDILRWAAIVGIVAIISAVMVMQLAIMPSNYEADMANFEEDLVIAGATIANVKKDVGDMLALGPLATIADLDAATNATGTNLSSMDGRITTAEGNITAICDDLASLNGSPPEGYLTGGFGNYTLHAKATEAGNYTADVILAYSAPITVGNTTYDDAAQTFYSSINMSVPSARYYEPSLIHNGAHWAVRRVTFNIGIFALEADTEKSVAVVFGGLNSTYMPSYAYVGIWPAL